MADTYAALKGDATSPWTDAITMKRPPSASVSAGQACLASMNGLVNRSATIVSQRSTGNSCDRRDVLDARVGNHQVEAAEALERRRDGVRVGLGRGQVGLEGDPGAGGIGLEVDGEHVDAIALQARGDRAADPARGARDERRPTVAHPVGPASAPWSCGCPSAAPPSAVASARRRGWRGEAATNAS